MTDKLKFVDISYLENQHGLLEAKRIKGVFAPRFMDPAFVKFEGEDHNPEAFDVLPYVELTQFQCQIIRDNIVEVIRFADTGRLRESSQTQKER